VLFTYLLTYLCVCMNVFVNHRHHDARMLLLQSTNETCAHKITYALKLRVTTSCLEKLEMSGNYTDVWEMSGISLKVMEMSANCREKILSWKIAQKLSVDGSGFYDVIIMKSLSLSVNLTVWSLTLTPVVQAWYEYQLKWSGVPRIIREMSGNFIVSGEWSTGKLQ